MPLKIIKSFLLLLAFNTSFAQKLAISPYLGVKFSKTRFISDSRGIKTFYSNYQPYPNVGFELKTQYNPQSWIFVKLRVMPIPVEVYGLMAEKPHGLLRNILDGNYAGSGSPAWSVGLGIAKKIEKPCLRKLSFYADANIAFMPKIDSLGEIYASIFGRSGIIRNFMMKDLFNRRFSPYLSMGLRHNFLNKRKKEIFSFDINYMFGFQYVAKSSVKYQVYDKNTGTLSPQYEAIAANKVNALTFSISKDIRIKR